jgi:hypothetical protein
MTQSGQTVPTTGAVERQCKRAWADLAAVFAVTKSALGE